MCCFHQNIQKNCFRELYREGFNHRPMRFCHRNVSFVMQRQEYKIKKCTNLYNILMSHMHVSLHTFYWYFYWLGYGFLPIYMCYLD